MTDNPEAFWRDKSLEEMTDTEWESLCDGCGRCCLQKLEDIETAEIHFTAIACKLLNLQTCRCSDYTNRFQSVPDCTLVRPLTDKKRAWLPDSCAYKLLDSGQPLPEWHPLLSNDPNSVFEAGISVRDFAVSEENVDQSDYPEYVIQWHDR